VGAADKLPETEARGERRGEEEDEEEEVFRGKSSIDMYNNDVGQESAQKIMKQTGDLKDATLYFAS
jgi:hypothetical protein